MVDVDAIPDRAIEPNAAWPPWHVLWTHSHCERRLLDHLSALGYEAFLPEVSVWSRRSGPRRTLRSPMFPGYVFLRHALDRRSYLEVRKARGLVTILGSGWDRLAVVGDREIEALRTLSDTGEPCAPYPFLREGTRVRIARGPLADVEGFLVRGQDEQGILVVSVDLLHRSVAVKVDCTSIVPA
jgi:transcription antitermination factor NusG